MDGQVAKGFTSSSNDADINIRAQRITRSLVENLITPLEQAIKQHLLHTPDDALDPEDLHLDASILNRQDASQQFIFRHSQSIPLSRVVSGCNTPPVSEVDTSNAYPSPVPSASSSRALRPRERNVLLRHEESAAAAKDSCRRKPTGGLRLGGGGSTSDEPSSRQLQSDSRNFPKRRKINDERSAMKPSTLDKLVISIWEQIHGSLQLDPQAVVDQWTEQRLITGASTQADKALSLTADYQRFNRVNMLCRKITQAARCCRSLEVIIQAHWISCYDERVQTLAENNSRVSITKHKMAVLKEACEDFGWTEKDLRNKMAVWRGYYELYQAGGWVPLIFAGMGLYRYCKYRIDFSSEALQKMRTLRPAFEVAADTLHPQWRRLLSIVEQSTEARYTGHPHDWAVSERGALPLRETYLQWDPHFSFEHLSESVIDEDAWGNYDPRAAPDQQALTLYSSHQCEKCGEQQSNNAKDNSCACFPNLYGSKRGPPPVQVFRTADGKNNGLMALCPFPRGTAIGEFLGLITTSLSNKDCMQSSTSTGPTYQIFQGRRGNFTRFVNHSCNPNSQYERFSWMGLQRIVLVSRGIEAGNEITVDYGERYWENLDKVCRCGEGCCRYREREDVRGKGVGEG